MKSVPAARRVSAIVAMAAVVALIAIMVLALARHLLWLAAAIGCLGVAIAAAAYAVTRTGTRRLVATVVAVVALAAPLVLVVVYGQLLQLIVVIALVAIAGLATRYALGRDIKSLKSGPTPGLAVGPATRPVLLMNPKSGGGKVERFGLVEEARRRGIEPIVLAPGDDLLRLAEQAVAGGADVIGMAGGDGSQALVAGVAMRHDVAFVCVPAGTRNHLAMDLGLDRDDVVAALDAFGAAVERRIDLGMVGDRVFVNNATVGLYAKIVQSPAYRDHKVGTALELLPEMLGPDAAPFDLRFTGPDGTKHDSAHLIMVSNDRYELGRAEGFGSRRRIDTGSLGIVAARFQSGQDAARFARRQSFGRTRRPEGWLEWSDTSFEVRSGRPVEIGIDGEALLLDPPIRFRILPGALRVRLPRHAPGYSPAAAVSAKGWATITALLQTAAGRPVTIEP
ncbi:MAG TPA: diacylglycerol kinase family protein [Actinomycetes bacterium]|nr:diacylglycerol kinase family protein [Actinomycetes bacterium]